MHEHAFSSLWAKGRDATSVLMKEGVHERRRRSVLKGGMFASLMTTRPLLTCPFERELAHLQTFSYRETAITAIGKACGDLSDPV